MLIIFIGLSACRDESIDENKTTNPISVDHKFVQTVFGQVKDASGLTIEGATVTMSGETYTTDENGFFFFDEMAVGNHGVQVSAIKEGYLYGGYRLYADRLSTGYVQIVLMEEKFLGNVSNNNGSVEISSNTTADFSNASFSLNGQDYNGEVQVYGNWIDPTSDNLLDLTPGDLRANDLNGQTVVLSSFGMIGMELRSAFGEEVKIKDGTEVELRFNIPNSILSEAPATIPLWTFDELDGIWIEEGSATLQGNQYIGNVHHFSWWNTDFPNPLVEICIQLVDQHAYSLDQLKIYLSTVNGFGCATGYTNSYGYVCGLIPADALLNITVYGYCDEVLYTGQIGPYSEGDSPVDLSIPVEVNEENLNSITGTVTECDASVVVPNAYLSFSSSQGTSITLAEADGTFAYEIMTCDNSIDLEITAADINSGTQGSMVLNNLNGGNYIADVALCDQIDEIFQSSDDNGDGSQFISCTAKQYTHETVISTEGSTFLGIKCFDVGTCVASYIGIHGTAQEGNVSVEITEYGGVNGKIVGSFSGTTSLGVDFDGNFVATRVQ